MNWAAFQACFEDRLLVSPVVTDKVASDKCIKEMASTIQEATAASAQKHRPYVDLRLLPPANIQDEKYLKE
jgi:hypothetical protein